MAIVTHTFIDKSNTIIKDSQASVGLNPILELNYGKMLTRAMIYFSHEKLKNLVEDKVYPDLSKMHHVLKMKNSGSIDDRQINKKFLDSNGEYIKERASSFDLIFFLIPNDWDEGKGFDYVQDMEIRNHKAYTTHGSNWYQYRDYFKWDTEGIYSTDRLSNELDLYTSKSGNLSKVIIGYEHFDKGIESIELDITDVVNKFITGELENHGIGIAFSPKYENISANTSQYVGFFSCHTHSFFEPYVETTYDECIEDDRENFYLNKNNKLYFYSVINGNLENLDEMPTCKINETTYEVKQSTKGVYYIEVKLNSNEYEQNTMLYDIWGNIKYNGNSYDDVELDFVTKNSKGHAHFGLPITQENGTIVPTLYGIKYKESIKRGDIRKINVDARIPFTTDVNRNGYKIQYRLYIKSGEKQIDVIDWQNVEHSYTERFFIINTNELIPSRYYIDLKVKEGMNLMIYRNILEFDIEDNITDYYN